MAKDRLGSQPTARLRIDVCHNELIPLVSVFPYATLVIEHPIHCSLNVGLFHEGSRGQNDVIETEKIRIVELRRYSALYNEVIVRPREQTFNAKLHRSLRKTNKLFDSGVSLSLGPKDGAVFIKQPDSLLHLEVWRLRFAVTDFLPFTGKSFPLFRACNESCKNKNIPPISALAAAAGRWGWFQRVAVLAGGKVGVKFGGT